MRKGVWVCGRYKKGRRLTMKKSICVGALMMLFFPMLGLASQFKVYPGASLDEKATKEARELATQAKQAGSPRIYTTKDPFQKVALFYKELGKEIAMPRSSGTKGNPKKIEKYDLWEAYFILDGALDLSSSKSWVKVQRPYIGERVRDVTAIVVVER